MRIWHSTACLRLVALLSLILKVSGQSGFGPLQPNTTTAADSVLTFNEIMYHPVGDDPGLEWVELYNQMSLNLDVSGWKIEGAVDFRFPTNSVIPADSYVIIAADPERMRSAMGVTNVFGPFAGRLANSSERLRLRNQSDRLLDEVEYFDEDPWPVGADGSGASLAKRDRYAASSPAANWRGSAEPAGTPGRINFKDGAPTEPVELPLIRAGASARLFIPADNRLGLTWIEPGFDDSDWREATSGIGYDTDPAPVRELSNVVLNKKVIAGSGAYRNNPFDVLDGTRNFTAQNVTDGSVSDVFGENYWLGREGVLQEHFTLDLGESFPIEAIHLRNTHNTQYNDRGTEDFEIWASQTIDASRSLVNPVRILKGRLSNVSGLESIPADVFTSANGLTVTNARYLRFIAVTANNPGNNVGLNELEVHSSNASGADRAFTFDGHLNESTGSGIVAENRGAMLTTNVPPALGRGQSLRFDGITNRVRVLDPVNPSAYTISVWAHVEAVQSSSIVLRTDARGPAGWWSHQLRINGAGRFEHFTVAESGRSVAATNVIIPGQWYHLAVRAAANGNMQIFVNGAQSGGSTAIKDLWTSGTEWVIGSSAGNAANFFRGLIDDFAIWHRELDDTAIRALAAGRSPAQLGGLHRYITTDLQDSLYNKGSSTFLRIPFEVLSPAAYAALTLRVRYADGFVAYLNGTEVARRNAPTNVEWDSTATINRPATDALQLESIALAPSNTGLLTGTNILALHALNFAPNDSAFLLAPELTARQAEIGAIENVAFSEIAGATNTNLFVELLHFGDVALPQAVCTLRSSSGGSYVISNSIPTGGTLVLSNLANLRLKDGDRLFLLGPAGELLDAAEVHNRGRARLENGADAPWFYTSEDTPGAVNAFSFHRDIVINEIMYHHRPQYRTKETVYSENDQQWIELYNRAETLVDLSGWRLTGDITFAFPAGTTLAGRSYLVVAQDSDALRLEHSDIAVIGNFDGRLSHNSARIVLLDTNDNPVDEVRYFNSHPWPSYANGGGSTLELRDPRADNSVPESWGASDETAKANWRRYSYRATAVRPVYSPGIFSFHELRLGLLDEGEALIDNITVTELPSSGAPRQLLQNSTFSNGTQAWRLLGNHSHSRIEPNPVESNNRVLRLVATGNTSYLDNRLETTLKVGSTLVPVVTGRDYEIAFDAKWLAGSPQVHTELYYNKVAATTILDQPLHSGTPGKRNSIYLENAGPTYSGLSHFPVIPKSTDTIEVKVSAADPDGIAAMQLFYSVNGGSWRSEPMTSLNELLYSGVIPRQPNGAVIQFYVQGGDSRGAVSTYPDRGRNSRALIKVDSTRLVNGKQTFRTIMTGPDSNLLHSSINMMSDDLLGCTVVHNEREVFYDARIRLHGSMFSRNNPSNVGLTVKFPANHLFRGSRESVIVRRRGLIETLVKHILNSAGGLPGNYDDVVHLVSHRSDNVGTARLNLANYDDTYVESQFEGDDNGTVFKLEGIREYVQTQNGNPEGLKVSQPIGWIQSFDIANLGDDPEQYRWGIMIQSDRKRDDYSRIVAMGKAFSLSGTALKQAAEEAIDVDEWARLFALQNLLGIADVYGVENPHNFAFYVRPSDGRVVGLQNDWEFAFNLSTTASIYGGKNVYKILRLPGVQRMYHGHLLDLIESVANSAYFTPWARHYTTVLGESYNNLPNYLAARGASVRNQLAARIPFEISSNGGADFSVDGSVATLEGRGWIDVYRVYRTGSSVPLKLNWLDNQRWQTTIPLENGANPIELSAFNYRGVQVGVDNISITSSATNFQQSESLRISELMYHPPPPSDAEMLAGFSDGDDFEFIEIANTGSSSVALAGVKLTLGISFDFGSGAIGHLAAGERVLAVKDLAAFQLRYGTNLPVSGEYAGSLANEGEVIRLVDADGRVIHEFEYGDGGFWPPQADGGGRSLEVLNVDGDYNDPSNWQASVNNGGTPGTDTSSAPVITSVLLIADHLEFSFFAETGVTYQVLMSDDLASWTVLKTVGPASGSLSTVSDQISEKARFYRLERLN